MKRFVLAAVLCGLAALAVPALAQEVQYSPPPMGPLQFVDPAMSFTAPDGYGKANVPVHDPVNLGDDVTTVALFGYHLGQSDQRVISIDMESFQGDLNGYEMRTENDLRNKIDGVFFKKKTLTTLPNGMPAYWQDITIGSGFNTVKRYQYVWVDRVRGVQLSISAPFGYITEDQAKQALSNVSATAFPMRSY